MIIGNPSVVAIESEISGAYASLSSRGLGYFVIHVKEHRYGVFEPDATMLACSLDEVEKRICDRGKHTAPFSTEDAGEIADAFRNAVYGEEDAESYLGIAAADFTEAIYSSRIVWAPDGDEAFDDGSYVLQFDIDDQVRLIAFKCLPDGNHDPLTLSEIWIAFDNFYAVLQGWRDSFVEEWTSMPKVS